MADVSAVEDGGIIPQMRRLTPIAVLVAVLSSPTLAGAATRPRLDANARQVCFEVAFYNGQEAGSAGRASTVAYMAGLLKRSRSKGARSLGRQLGQAVGPAAQQAAVDLVTRFCARGGDPVGPNFYLPR